MKNFKIGFALFVLSNFIVVQTIAAYPPQDHVVSIQEVQKQVHFQSSQRSKNIQDIQKLLQHSEVQKHLGGLYDLQKISIAVANLDDETLEDLANRSRLANNQLQAGVSDVGLIIVVVLVVITVVVVVVILSAKDLLD